MTTDEIKLFKQNWENSSASRLLIHGINSTPLELRKEEGFLASIALMAFRNGSLSTLDCLMNKYDIIEKGTDAFKGKLKENWLENDEAGRRNISSDTLSSITELAAAYYLESEGFEVCDLEAWGGPNDISCSKDGKEFGFEVKLLPDSPEFYKLRLDAAKSESGVPCDSMPPHPHALNYFYFRMAQANIQLGKKKSKSGIPAVFFVFTESVPDFFINEFLKSLGNRKEWYKEGNDIPGIPPNTKLPCEAFLKTPDGWFNETKILYMAKMKKYCLKLIYPTS